VVKVLSNLRPNKAAKFKMPMVCPICGGVVRVEDQGNSILHFCTNKRCSARQAGQLSHFVGKGAFNIEGLGGKIIERFIESGLISNAADIFSLKPGDIAVLEGFGDKSAANLIQSISQAKVISLRRFLYALGIPHLGTQLAHSLADFLTTRFGHLALNHLDKHLKKLTVEDLESIVDFGPKVSASLLEWIGEERHQQLLERLASAGVKLVYSSGGQSFLEGQIFVLTGSLKTLSRDEAGELIVECGGKVSESVGQDTGYLVVGEKPGSKLAKAQKLGVKIIDETALLKLVRK